MNINEIESSILLNDEFHLNSCMCSSNSMRAKPMKVSLFLANNFPDFDIKLNVQSLRNISKLIITLNY